MDTDVVGGRGGRSNRGPPKTAADADAGRLGAYVRILSHPDSAERDLSLFLLQTISSLNCEKPRYLQCFRLFRSHKGVTRQGSRAMPVMLPSSQHLGRAEDMAKRAKRLGWCA